MTDIKPYLTIIAYNHRNVIEICPRCQCCELITEECEQCNDGLDGHDCDEDSCCCAFPEDNLTCQFCNGRGYFTVCVGSCDKDGKHRSEQP